MARACLGIPGSERAHACTALTVFIFGHHHYYRWRRSCCNLEILTNNHSVFSGFHGGLRRLSGQLSLGSGTKLMQHHPNPHQSAASQYPHVQDDDGIIARSMLVNKRPLFVNQIAHPGLYGT